MHAKERIIAPIMREVLDIDVAAPEGLAERVPSLPLGGCREPTRLIVREILRRKSGAHEVKRPATSERTVDPGLRHRCDP